MSEESRILMFQKSFEIGDSDANNVGFMDWVYGSRDISVDDLPTDTSLQKRLKPFLMNGGKIEWTSGKLVKERFSNASFLLTGESKLTKIILYSIISL